MRQHPAQGVKNAHGFHFGDRLCQALQKSANRVHMHVLRVVVLQFGGNLFKGLHSIAPVGAVVH